MNLKNILALMGFCVLIASGFYWFELRPANLRKACFAEGRRWANSVMVVEKEMEEKGIIITKKADFDEVQKNRYWECLREKGLPD